MQAEARVLPENRYIPSDDRELDPAGEMLAALVRGQSTPSEPQGTQPSVACAPNSTQQPSAVSPGALAPLLYSHQAMVELMLQHPGYGHKELAAAFGRPASWMASVLASDSFQSALDPVRHLIHDPSLTASLNERYKALAIRTSNVLLEKMDKTEISELLVLKASEISIKALGMGTAMALPAPTQQRAGVETLAERLLEAMATKKRRDSADIEDAIEVPRGG